MNMMGANNVKLKKVLWRILLATVTVFCFCLGAWLFVGQMKTYMADKGYTDKEFADKEYTDKQQVQRSIAERVLRLHIVADSDEQVDQSVKLRIKEAVLQELEPVLAEASSKEEVMEAVNDNLEELVLLADKILEEGGFEYRATAGIEQCEFPVKVYGDLTLPAGVYDSLQIRLGRAKGKNWWCMIYPKLCFVDVTYGSLPEQSKKELREVLTEDEYKLVMSDKSYAINNKKVKKKVKFKLLEWVKSIWN